MQLFRLLTLVATLTVPLITSCSTPTKTGSEYQYRSKEKKRSPSKSAKTKTTSTPLTIVIDPGHGGFDLGAHSRIHEEKDINLKTALVVKRELLKNGYRVIMTRSRDEFIPLQKRAQIANENRSQILVSIHYNSAPVEQAKGVEIFYYDKAEPWRQKKSKELAQTVLSKVLSRTGANSRGVKTGNFCVIRETKMPSILVEGGFMTNDAEGKLLKDDSYLEKVGLAISEGLDLYFKSMNK